MPPKVFLMLLRLSKRLEEKRLRSGRGCGMGGQQVGFLSALGTLQLQGKAQHRHSLSEAANLELFKYIFESNLFPSDIYKHMTIAIFFFFWHLFYNFPEFQS